MYARQEHAGSREEVDSALFAGLHVEIERSRLSECSWKHSAAVKISQQDGILGYWGVAAWERIWIATIPKSDRKLANRVRAV